MESERHLEDTEAACDFPGALPSLTPAPQGAWIHISRTQGSCFPGPWPLPQGCLAHKYSDTEPRIQIVTLMATVGAPRRTISHANEVLWAEQ